MKHSELAKSHHTLLRMLCKNDLGNRSFHCTTNLRTVYGKSIHWTVKTLSHVRLFATPWSIAYQAPLSTGFSGQEYWSGLPFPSLGDLPNPGIKPRSPTLQADALPPEPSGKPNLSAKLLPRVPDGHPGHPGSKLKEKAFRSLWWR